MAASEDPLALVTPYELRHLVNHLETAGRAPDLHRLLRLSAPASPDVNSGRHASRALEHAWFAGHRRIDDLAGFMSDIATAWRVAELQSEAQIADGTPAVAIGLEARYALVISSIRSLSATVPAALVARLVETGEWTLARGLDEARVAPTALQRAESLSALARYLSDDARMRVLREALDNAWRIPDVSERLRVTAVVAVELTEPGRTTEIERACAHAIAAPEHKRDKTVAAVAPYLPIRLMSHALDAVETIVNDSVRRSALDALAPHLDPTLAERALRVARRFDSVFDRAEAIAHLAARLDEPRRSEEIADAVRDARSVRPAWELENGLLLMPSLGRAERTALVNRMVRDLARAPAIEARARRLAALAPWLGERRRTKLLEGTLAAAESIDDEDDRWMRDDVLARLTPLFPETRRLELAEAALNAIDPDMDGWKELFEPLVPHLPDHLMARALSMVLGSEGLDPPTGASRALTVLAPRLPP